MDASTATSKIERLVPEPPISSDNLAPLRLSLWVGVGWAFSKLSIFVTVL